jgi:hypothetical protein
VVWPRYLIARQPQAQQGVPPHAGTTDVDLVLDLQVLASVEAYRWLEQNFKVPGFHRCQSNTSQLNRRAAAPCSGLVDVLYQPVRINITPIASRRAECRHIGLAQPPATGSATTGDQRGQHCQRRIFGSKNDGLIVSLRFFNEPKKLGN